MNTLDIEKLNQTTYKINKSNKKKEIINRSLDLKTKKHQLPQLNNTLRGFNNETSPTHRDLVKDANLLKNLIQIKTMDKKSPKNIK